MGNRKSLKLKIRVIPGASDNSVSGWLGDTLKVRVRELPEKGKANDSVIKLIADTLDIDRRRISIVSGQASSRKFISISGITEDEIKCKIPC